eukprot:CAMPEP_0181121292 /NCGR_PEP_ID=MMETSP1071-20121207/24658_1 /TAXON_ID=35127 /ORGANISM="Thalassiosira sp., Strain NH16" /LENGTH=765 /DNA_ID=CAMNT_0023206097 /DNA_START=60 /DNA_END=2357 /DNA_ORIENTATION=-
MKLLVLVSIALAGISSARSDDGATLTALRGGSHQETDLPEFFPKNMKKEKLGLYEAEAEKKAARTSSYVDDTIEEVNNDDWIHECAYAFQKYGDPSTGRVLHSNFYLVDKPAGLCADYLSCAFERCHASLDGGANWDAVSCLMNQTALDSTTYDEASKACSFPPSALPASITFPKNAAEVISAINFASESGLQVSIKNRGHCYTGCHTKPGTLMINTRDLVKYAVGADSVVECEDSVDVNCALAKARGKDAYIRVGAGQAFSDLYLAVNASNTAGHTSKDYWVIGGGSGSVGAAGGWITGGGISMGLERLEGIGVDNVLEFELVLADGRHVRVFPTEWENVKGCIYPQTTKVTALCNENTVADESQWDWQPCADLMLPPEDLWRASRGGGGGTFAVTLSIKYHLFEMIPMRVVLSGLAILSTVPEEAVEGSKDAFDTITSHFEADSTGRLRQEASRAYTLFWIDFLYAPEKIGVSKDTSTRCGSMAIDMRFDSPLGSMPVFCWGDSVMPELQPAWERVVAGLDLAMADPELAEALSKFMFFDLNNLHGNVPYANYAEFATSLDAGGPMPPGVAPDGVIPDWPGTPTYMPPNAPGTYCAFNIPLGLLKSDDYDERDLVYKILSEAWGEHVTGGNIAFFGDGMDAVSPSERASGWTGHIDEAVEKYGEQIVSDLWSAVYKYTDVDGFSGVLEYNHLCSDAKTPSKDDWSKVCSADDDEDCFSSQESVWGEKLHAKLQRIKSAADPNNMFDCYPCIKPESDLNQAMVE